MRLMILALIAAALAAQPPSTAGPGQQEELRVGSNDLDRAEQLLQQAWERAARAGTAEEEAALARLIRVYGDLQKRDGEYWRNLMIPLIRRALEIHKGSGSTEITNELAVKSVLAVIELPAYEFKVDLSEEMAKRLDQLIAQLEARYGPLNVRTAEPYDALTYAPKGSEMHLRASHGCDLLLESDDVKPEFAMLIVHCAEAEALERDPAGVLRLARKARAVAAPGGARFAYETVLAHITEARVAISRGDTRTASAAVDAARDLAANSLWSGNPVVERIFALRERLTSLGLKNHELVPRPGKPKHPRIQPAQILNLAETKYTAAAWAEKFEGTASVAVMVTAEGSGRVINTFRGLPYDLSPNIEKAVSESRFQPWMKDGKAVAGVSVFSIHVRPPPKRPVLQ